jgi:hypothetical protein
MVDMGRYPFDHASIAKDPLFFSQINPQSVLFERALQASLVFNDLNPELLGFCFLGPNAIKLHK